MSETLDGCVDSTVNHLLAAIFSAHIKEPIAVEMMYEFSSPVILERVEVVCKEIGIEFHRAPTKKNPFAVQVKMDDIMRTKFFIAMRCAKKKKRCIDLKKEVDFECHGENWKAPDDLPASKYTLRHNIYKATYGSLKV